MVEDYLRNEISKTNFPQTTDKSNDLVNHIAKLDKHEHSREDGTNGNDMVKGTPPTNINVTYMLHKHNHKGVQIEMTIAQFDKSDNIAGHMDMQQTNIN